MIRRPLTACKPPEPHRHVQEVVFTICEWIHQRTLNQAHRSHHGSGDCKVTKSFSEFGVQQPEMGQCVLQFTRPPSRNSLRPSTMQGTKRSIARPALKRASWVRCIRHTTALSVQQRHQERRNSAMQSPSRCVAKPLASECDATTDFVVSTHRPNPKCCRVSGKHEAAMRGYVSHGVPSGLLSCECA